MTEPGFFVVGENIQLTDPPNPESEVVQMMIKEINEHKKELLEESSYKDEVNTQLATPSLTKIQFANTPVIGGYNTGMFDFVNSRAVVPLAGIYDIHGCCTYEWNGSHPQYFSRLNMVVTRGSNSKTYDFTNYVNHNDNNTITFSMNLSLEIGDTLELYLLLGDYSQFTQLIRGRTTYFGMQKKSVCNCESNQDEGFTSMISKKCTLC